MKKSLFIILPLILWAFAACDNDDSEWDSGNLGVNSVEGTWQRVGAYPKVLAIFGSDYTSTIQTFDVDDNLVTDYPKENTGWREIRCSSMNADSSTGLNLIMTNW